MYEKNKGTLALEEAIKEYLEIELKDIKLKQQTPNPNKEDEEVKIKGYVGYIPSEKNFEVAAPCFTVRTEKSRTQNEIKTARVRVGVTLYNTDTLEGHKELTEVISKIEYYLRGKNIIGRCFVLAEDAPVDIDTSETGFYPFWIGELFISYDLPAPVDCKFL